MGYVAKGKARMSIMAPSGEVITYYLKQGDVYIVPVSYPHQIEDLEDFTFLVFFDQAVPQDIGHRKVGSDMERIFAATLGVDQSEVPDLPYVYIDPLIVSRPNPVDPLE